MAAPLPIGNDTLGCPLPAVLHAITVSLPTWSDNVGYLTNQEAIIDAMSTGYPRFFIHRSIQELIEICQEKFGLSGELCLLYPTQSIAEHGKEFTHNQALLAGKPSDLRIVHYVIHPMGDPPSTLQETSGLPVVSQSVPPQYAEVFALFFHADTYKVARRFWEHCGLGISSRYAEHCLSVLGIPDFPKVKISKFFRVFGKTDLIPKSLDASELPLTTGADAKAALRQRIASYFVRDESPTGAGTNVSEDDVFLYPCGMSALWNAHQLLLASRPLGKSVVFGFLYTDTLKILEKSGPGAIFYGHGRDCDVDDLDAMLARKVAENPSAPPILALYTECPSNPRLCTVNIRRLRALADKYDFLIVIDETVGSFANVDVLPYADIIMTSLSKYVGGYATALGGSLVINPRMRHRALLKEHLALTFEDTYFTPDAIVMERNSRDFFERMRIVNTNTEYICDFLRMRSIKGGASESEGAVIKQVWYPKYITPEDYQICRRRLSTDELDRENGGYGGLFSLTFTSLKASRAFHDALEVAKGPSYGTTFTLVCPYTLLGHYSELEFAAEYGVEEGLVRVGIGTEDREALLRAVDNALRVAESA
ncbi:pyridoxal phosphate-dependent transferase [Pisolithus orientalis]|uniref:pyridoxal phosphate-dependent transferase n=1 Tax=Pisolithus orientalis TaxID=936130 RepID=UPI0022240B5D|nr:pyridoxal phosphate-dependent transferase [Pisolithus orientalis]KAI6020026.1 pyridoxal phosphate-dependent transferase [Pisolithus orientalis]